MGLRMVCRSSGMGGIFPGLINTRRPPLRVTLRPKRCVELGCRHRLLSLP
jgi:hypothetical protein